MRKLVVITLFLILTLVGITSLSAGVTPNSPDYDAWKKQQVYTPEAAVKPTQTSSPFTIVDNQNKDICDLLIPWDDTFTLAMAPNDDWSTDQMTLPFTFSLYGSAYNHCWINNNGNISFDGPYGTYSAYGFPYYGFPMVAPFWADVDTRGAGSVWYKMGTNYMVVIWDHVGYYPSEFDKLNTFELIISDGTYAPIGLGNNVAFSYADMAWTTGSASGGSGGFGGTPANVGINKGDGISYAQIGRFDHAGTDYDGPYDNNDGVDWLDCQLFLFNTGGQSANVAPIFVTVPPSPVTQNIGSTWNFSVTIISPESEQVTTAVVNHSMPSGMAYVVTPGNTCTINFTIDALASNVGTHLITMIATDDGTPNLSASYEFEFVVNPPSGYTFQVNSYDLLWWQTNGYEMLPPPAHNDPNDLGSMIMWDDPNDAPDMGWIYTGKNTPYIFTAGLDWLPGIYTVYNVNYGYWLPETVSFVDITTNYSVDFLGFNDEDTPVELSSFTAVLTAANYVQLTWVSQSESNMLGYRVYRNEINSQASASVITPTLIPAYNTSIQQSYTVTDNEVVLGRTYYYWLESVDMGSSQFFGPLSIVVEGDVPPVLPTVSSMRNAYPNPFRASGSTSIEVDVKEGENGTVTIYNVLGQIVKTVSVTPGSHTINWNGKDSKGNACSSGIYFYKLSTPSVNQTKKMVIVK